MTKPSFKDRNARKAGETPFQFELVNDDGSLSGIKVQVLGGHSDAVTKRVNELVNERRRQEAIREATANRPGEAVTPVEDDIAFAQRLAAVRLVGWDYAEDCSPENALEFCQANPDYAAQITAKSNAVSNFINASPKK